MNARIAATLLALAFIAPLVACQDAGSDSKPLPVAMTDDALGHYCQMYVAEHGGPKAQIAQRGSAQPIWFVQVSDAVVYLNDKERSGEILAIYVSDMSKAPSWGEPGRSNWIDAESAYYVIASAQMGGMDTPEAIPFGTEAAAKAFAGTHGGKVVRLADIPLDYVRNTADAEAPAADN